VKLYVDRGNRVNRGSPIAKLDTRNLEAQRLQLVAQKARAEAVLAELQNGARTEDIAAARSQVRDLEQQLSLEKIKRDRRERLWREGAISREQFDEIAYGSNALSERLAAARSNLDELLTGTRQEQITAQQAEVRQLQASIADIDVTIAKSTIKAPFSGIVAAQQLDEGTVVNAGQTVVRLVEDVNPEVEIGVPTQVIEQLKLASQQQVKIGQKTYTAKVASILPEVNPATRTRTVVLTLPSSISSLLAPKQVARLQVQQNVATTGYWLPTTALVRGERGLWAFYSPVETQDRSYQVERRDVEVLHTAGDRALVRGTIQPGDKAIVDGTQRVVPGQLVKIIRN
jgi:multidrug efflux pump subunit AcrA (membrane-fusion protein)